MKKRIFFYFTALLILVLDTKTAMAGVREAIQLCLQTVVPSLFPFMVLTSVLTGLLSRFSGYARYFLLGILGGYPTGAQAISQGVKDGQISRETGRNLLAFCSNAGPAFLFGMGANLFPNAWMCWAVWGIHLLSALLVSLFFPIKDEIQTSEMKSEMTLIQALSKSVRVMGLICGWVILFRVVLSFFQRWFLWYLPGWLGCLLCGILELSNGCVGLMEIESIQIRFILFSIFLGFGGVCIAMQTFAVTEGMDASLYLPGKLLQALFSAILSASFFSREIALFSIPAFIFLFVKKGIAFGPKLMYNRANHSGRKLPCSFAKRSSPCAPTVSTPRS